MPLVSKCEIKLKALTESLQGKAGKNKTIGRKQYSEIEEWMGKKCLILKICNFLRKCGLIFFK